MGSYMARLITVRPVEAGWVLSDEGLSSEQFFVSGAKAERAARNLLDRLARVGEAAELQIYTRNGLIVGRFVAARAPEVA